MKPTNTQSTIMNPQKTEPMPSSRSPQMRRSRWWQRLSAAGLTLGLSLLGTVTQAQINMTSATTPPSVGYYDQSYLPGVVVEGTDTIDSPFTSANGSGYNDADTYVSNPDRTSKAQSFTTGPNPSGYILNSFTFQQADGAGTWLANGTFFQLNQGDSVLVRFGSLPGGPSSTAYNSIMVTNATYNGATYNTGGTASGLGVFFNFDFSGSGLTLAPNTTYFVEIMATGSDHFELNNTSTNPVSATIPPVYTGGAALSGATTAGLDATGTFNTPPQGGAGGSGGGEFAFDASLTPVGAPSVAATIDISTATNGQDFTITATVTPGAGTVTNVTVDLTPIGLSLTNLVLSSGAVWTNTFTVPIGGPDGATNLIVTAIDTTPLLAQASLAFFVYTPVAPSETAFITPAGGVSDQGLAFSLAVGFTGNPALSYQWQHSPDNNNDYTNIPSSINSSATNTVLVFSSLTLDESGYYQVVVTNLAGSTVSEVVGLTVLATVPTYAWAYPVSMDTLTANQVLTNFPDTYIAGALVAKNGGQPITVTDAGSDTPIVFAGAGAWASLSGGSGYRRVPAPRTPPATPTSTPS